VIVAGVHRPEEDNGDDVRHEVHEQEPVHREGRLAERAPGGGDHGGTGTPLPGQYVVLIPR